MNKNYEELFRTRGSAYDRAMQHYPHAREQEFMQAVDRADLRPGMVVADVPAGGGYLKDYLPDGCIWRGHEPCASFIAAGSALNTPASHNTPVTNSSLLPLPWPDNSVDVALSIAGVHHLEDKRSLFAELHRVVKPGGRFVLSDVAEGTAVARFLDGYVGDNNSTGHEGVFLSENTLMELQEAGWRIFSNEYVGFHWIFNDRKAMGAFCNGLFDICQRTVEETLIAIESELGVDRLPDGRLGMRWGLKTIVAQTYDQG